MSAGHVRGDWNDLIGGLLKAKKKPGRWYAPGFLSGHRSLAQAAIIWMD